MSTRTTRNIGRTLAGIGLLVGFAVSLSLALPIQLVGVSWLIAVGLVKLTFVASLGLIGAGAVLQRLANRADERQRLSAPLNGRGDR